MPWWSWLIIWVVLALALVALLGLSAWWLFRKAIKVADDLSDLASLAEQLDVGDATPSKPQIAVLEPAAVIQEREQARKDHRSELRVRRHEARIARAKLITGADASSMQWPDGWYHKHNPSSIRRT